MKLKNIILALTLCFSQLVLADDSKDLQNIIFKHDGLKADFSQTVTKADGSLVTKSSGDLALKRPDNFILNTTDPDEQVLFTKQNEVWFYDAFVNQVTIFSKNDLYTSPFLLLTSRDPKVWASYTIEKNGDTYTLTPSKKGEVNSLSLTVKNDTITSIKLKMKDGNINQYELSNQSYEVSDSVFNYQVPKDAQIDDERRSN